MKILSEKQIERKFKQYSKKFIDFIGHDKSTSNIELNNLGKLHIPSFIGVFSQNSKIPTTPRLCNFIINTDLEHQPGTHWIAIHRTKNNKYYIFDSFGRSSKKLIPHFVRGKMHVDSDYDVNQSESSEICGALCLAWLKCVSLHGVRNALKI